MKKLFTLCFLLSTFLGAEESRRAPGFSLPDVKLEQHDLQDYRGKVLVLEFMRTDCHRCEDLVKQLVEFKKGMGDKVEILSVVNPPDNQTTVTRYIKEHDVTWPMVFDSGQVAASYARITPENPSLPLPQLFIIDQNGMIRSHSCGDANPAEFEF